MGLAERFKTQLNTRDIFQKTEAVEDLMEGIKFISTPIEAGAENSVQPEIQPEIKNEVVEVSTAKDYETEFEKKHYSTVKFEELETDIINKIRKTPYWEDYSRKRQENMISKYFDIKTKRKRYSQYVYSLEDRNEFIQNILTLSNNR